MSQIMRYLKDEDFKLNIKNNTIYIDNYQKVEKLADNEISIISIDKIIEITGKDFTIKKLLDKEILFTGEIKNIKFIQK